MADSAHIIQTQNGRWMFSKYGMYPVCPDASAANIGINKPLSKINVITAVEANLENLTGNCLKNLVTKNDIVLADKIDENVSVKYSNIQDMPEFLPLNGKAQDAKTADVAKTVDYENIKNKPKFVRQGQTVDRCKEALAVDWNNVQSKPELVLKQDYNLLNTLLHEFKNVIIQQEIRIRELEDKKLSYITIDKDYKLTNDDVDKMFIIQKDVTITADNLDLGFNCSFRNKASATFVGFANKDGFTKVTERNGIVTVLNFDDEIIAAGLDE